MRFEPDLKKVFWLSLGHCTTDLYPAFLPPLLPILVEKFHFTYTEVSLLAMVLSICASMSQPVFGYISDRIGGRWMILAGPLLSGFSLSAIGLADHSAVLVLLLIIGGLGASFYHPEAAALASSLSGRQRTLGLSIFMVGGNVGYGLGPLLILGIAMSLGLQWSLLAALPALAVVWLLHRNIPAAPRVQALPAARREAGEPGGGLRLIPFAILWSLALLRVTATMTLITFLPTIQSLRGFSLLAAGSSFSIFMLCAGLGGLTGGFLADRLGRKRIITSSFALLIPVLAAFLYWRGPSSFAILALLGFLFFLSESPCIILAQEMAPGKARTVSGLIMGMAWGIGGLGVLATGALADIIGIEKALRFLLVLPLAAFLLSFALPSARGQAEGSR